MLQIKNNSHIPHAQDSSAISWPFCSFYGSCVGTFFLTFYFALFFCFWGVWKSSSFAPSGLLLYLIFFENQGGRDVKMLHDLGEMGEPLIKMRHRRCHSRVHAVKPDKNSLDNEPRLFHWGTRLHSAFSHALFWIVGRGQTYVGKLAWAPRKPPCSVASSGGPCG